MDNVIAVIGICVALFSSCLSLWSTQKAQQQNVNIQLFNKRYKIYLLLMSWHEKINAVFSGDTDGRFDKIMAFRIEMLKYFDDEKLLYYSSRITELENTLKTSGETKHDAIRTKQHEIYQEKCKYTAISVRKMQHAINKAIYLFSLDKADVNKIKKITSTYLDITIEIMIKLEGLGKDPESEQEKKLNAEFETLREINNGMNGVAKILGKMEDQLNELRGSFS